MARFNMEEADKYVPKQNSYFALSNDKDVAQVRILYDTVDDIEGYSVYKVTINGTERYVNSIRGYNDPVDVDPFAASGMRPVLRMFIPVMNVTSGEVLLWERGKTYYSKLASLARRYKPLYNQIVEIERNGAKGDSNTTYDIYPITEEVIDISTVEIPDALGTVVLDKSFEEMEYFLEHGDFPSNDSYDASRNTQPANATPPTRRPNRDRKF